MNDHIVTIIVPCYNSSATLHRYLDSIINQTYKNIQLIAIDDGSVDATAKILQYYKEIFHDNGMQLIYVYQKNQGLGGAINTGLKYIQGDFLCWSDPDDFYYPESIEMRLNILLNHTEYGVVSSDAYMFSESDLKNPIKKTSSDLTTCYDEWQFEHLLKGESIYCAGCHMIRMKAFDDVNPTRSIYPGRFGQNIQMLLPIYFKYKRFYLNVPLYGYVVYKNSMSHSNNSEEKELEKWDGHKDILLSTLDSIAMPIDQRDKYKNYVIVKNAEKKFYTAIDYRDYKLLRKQYYILEELNAANASIVKGYRRNKNLFNKVLFKILEEAKK